MIWILDPTATWFWLVANTSISAAYCTVLSHALPKFVNMDTLWARRLKAFIYMCGVGHLSMMVFMTMLMHEVWAWRIVVFWDCVTAIVSVEFALRVWGANRRAARRSA